MCDGVYMVSTEDSVQLAAFQVGLCCTGRTFRLKPTNQVCQAAAAVTEANSVFTVALLKF